VSGSRSTTRQLGLREQVERICADQNWPFGELPGNLGLFGRWLTGYWNAEDILVVPLGQSVGPSCEASVIRCTTGCQGCSG
jgi:hypothetical protein